jgi:hypothetical protein
MKLVMPVISGIAFVIHRYIECDQLVSPVFTCDNMASKEHTFVFNELDLANSVESRHLPHYTRFRVDVSFSGVGQVVRTYNPLSLSSLASTLVVANSTPEMVQR